MAKEIKIDAKLVTVQVNGGTLLDYGGSIRNPGEIVVIPEEDLDSIRNSVKVIANSPSLDRMEKIDSTREG